VGIDKHRIDHDERGGTSRPFWARPVTLTGLRPGALPGRAGNGRHTAAGYGAKDPWHAGLLMTLGTGPANGKPNTVTAESFRPRRRRRLC